MSVVSSSRLADTVSLFEEYVIANYRRFPVSLVRGKGSTVWDQDGNAYLDLFPGWGCNLLGHCPPAIVQAVQDQVATLIHVPNTWYIESQALWAQRLSERSFGGKAFFCNSGAEANETALKLARLHGHPDRYKIITCHRSFHGRTFGALTATGQPKYHEGMGPLLPGFSYVRFGDVDAIRGAIDEPEPVPSWSNRFKVREASASPRRISCPSYDGWPMNTTCC